MPSIPGSPRHLVGPRARRLEQLLGLRPYSVRAVERRSGGDITIKFREQLVGDGYRSRRTLRIPARRVQGYRPHSSLSRASDRRARARVNARRMAWWLEARLGFDCPVVARAVYDRDYGGIEELRAILRSFLGPDFVVVWLEPVWVPDYVPQEWTA